jgi:hypothetical protein
MKCNICKKKVKQEEIYALYHEDSSYICKKCFGNIKSNNNTNKNSPLKK